MKGEWIERISHINLYVPCYLLQDFEAKTMSVFPSRRQGGEGPVLGGAGDPGAVGVRDDGAQAGRRGHPTPLQVLYRDHLKDYAGSRKQIGSTFLYL